MEIDLFDHLANLAADRASPEAQRELAEWAEMLSRIEDDEFVPVIRTQGARWERREFFVRIGNTVSKKTVWVIVARSNNTNNNVPKEGIK